MSEIIQQSVDNKSMDIKKFLVKREILNNKNEEEDCTDIPPSFNSEQKSAFIKFKNGENIFITGPGGSGKSYFIQQIFKYANDEQMRIQVCALTGCAAILLECSAKTIHSWGHIGLASGKNEEIANKIKKSNLKRVNWTTIDVLVIDEVSMMSQKIFELLDLIGKVCRRNDKPFGGIRLVFSGDFYQLPPVGNNNDEETSKFCFESPLWNEVFPIQNQIEFKYIFRQDDEVFKKILNEIREGKLFRSSLKVLEGCIGKQFENDSIKPTILYPTKKMVDIVNQKEMEKLEDQDHTYSSSIVQDESTQTNTSKYTPTELTYEINYLNNNCLCDKTLCLKKGAQVMCVANLDMASRYPIVNGSQGIIVDFTEKDYPIVKFLNGSTVTIKPNVWRSEKYPSIGLKQIPLILAWAITIHKSQGITLAQAEIDAGNRIFECGQTYVALSRVKNLDGLFLTSFNPQQIKVKKKVKDYYNNLRSLH
jgi:ATP-dependent DNA helicase PIF1